MSAIVSTEPIIDKISEALRMANRFAAAAGVEPETRRITLSQRVSEEGVPVWRVNYGPSSPTLTRGGDFIVEVYAEDSSFYRILNGQ